MLSNAKKLIEQSKLFNSMDENTQKLYNSTSQAYQCLNSRDFEQLVASLIMMKETIVEVNNIKYETIEQQSAMSLETNLAQRTIEDIVTSVSTNPQDLLAFGFYLRKADPQNAYSADFLSGAVKPQILTNILLSQTWDSQAEEMLVNEQSSVRLVVGKS